MCQKYSSLSSLSAQTKLKMHTAKFTHGALYDARRMYNLLHGDCCKLSWLTHKSPKQELFLLCNIGGTTRSYGDSCKLHLNQHNCCAVKTRGTFARWKFAFAAEGRVNMQKRKGISNSRHVRIIMVMSIIKIDFTKQCSLQHLFKYYRNPSQWVLTGKWENG
jgi:hypothetical protein